MYPCIFTLHFLDFIITMNGDHFNERSVVTSVSSGDSLPEDMKRALRESDDALRSFVHQAPVALAMFDSDMRYVAVSRPWSVLFETGDAEQPGRLHYDVFPDLPEHWRAAHRRGLAGEHLSKTEDFWIRPDGTTSWHHWELAPWRGANGEIGGIVLFIENISASKAVEAVLRMVSVDAAGMDFASFPAFATRRISEILGIDFVQLSQPCADAPGWAQTIAVFSNGAPAPDYRYPLARTPCEQALRRRFCMYPSGARDRFPDDADLHRFKVESYAGTTLADTRGEILGLLSVMSQEPFRDPEMVRSVLTLAGIGIGALMDSHRATAAIQASERFSSALLETMSSHIAVLDDAGTIVFANEAWFNFARDNGMDMRKAGIGVSYLAVCDAAAATSAEAAHAARLLRAVLSGQKSEGSFEYPCPSPTAQRWFKCTVRRFTDADKVMVLVAHENVSDIKLAHRRSEQVEQKFQHLFESAPDAVLITDRIGTIRLANLQAAQLFGHDAGTLEGRPIKALIRRDGTTDPDAVLLHFLQGLEGATGGTISGTIHGMRSDGSSFPGEISLSKYVEDDETFYIVAVRDISLRLAAETDKLARQSAEQANYAKSAFLATMSHEIRTPLNAVLGFSEVLSHSTLDDDQANLLQNMRSSAEHLLGLIDNVLDLSKIEAGELELEHEAFDLPALIVENARALSGFAFQRKVQISLFIAPEIPRRMVSDPARLRQVVYNLLGNAIKFSGGNRDKGRVMLRVQFVQGPKPALQLTVQDNGIGMTTEVRERVFQPFVQAESSITRRFGGTGLGLTITKRIVDRMNGQIRVASTPGEGTIFTVTIPLDPAPAQPPATPPRLKGLRCLLAESGAYLADDLALYLLHEGAQVKRLETAGDTGAGADVLIVGSDFSAPDTPLAALPRVTVCDLDARPPQGSQADRVCLRAELMTCDSLVKAVQRARGPGSRDAEAGPEQAKEAPGQVGAVPRFEAQRYQPILVVEDDTMNQKVILRQLSLLGLHADLAEDGVAALQRLEEKPYGLVLADLHMPNMDGYAMTAAIRAREAERGVDIDNSVTVLALTANALRDEIGRTEQAGFDGFLTKPMTLVQLADTIATYLPLATES